MRLLIIYIINNSNYLNSFLSIFNVIKYNSRLIIKINTFKLIIFYFSKRVIKIRVCFKIH